MTCCVNYRDFRDLPGVTPRCLRRCDHAHVASALARSRSFATLARWLGPWTPDARAPVVDIEQLPVDDRFPARLYRPRGRAIGAFAIAPGVHYAGPDDPRMDRFSRVLAASGIVTLAPWLPDFVAMRVAPTA